MVYIRRSSDMEAPCLPPARTASASYVVIFVVAAAARYTSTRYALCLAHCQRRQPRLPRAAVMREGRHVNGDSSCRAARRARRLYVVKCRPYDAIYHAYGMARRLPKLRAMLRCAHADTLEGALYDIVARRRTPVARHAATTRRAKGTASAPPRHDD